MRDTRKKPKGNEIRVCLDSGANIHSANCDTVTPATLGFESKAEWDAASDDEKHQAVVDYFSSIGYPEYSWDDAESVT